MLDRSEEAAWKSFRNLGERVQIILPDELNAYDVLVNDSIVFSRATLNTLTARFDATSDATDRAGDAESATGTDGAEDGATDE